MSSLIKPLKRLIPAQEALQANMARGAERIILAIPMGWLCLFLLVPCLFLLALSFSEIAISRPPYTEIFHYENAVLTITANLENWLRLFEDTSYIATFFSSLWIAFWSGFLALLIGFPMAWTIARAHGRVRHLLLLLVILPFWTSFLLRIYALKSIFYNQGPVNAGLMSLGVIDQPIQFLNTDFAVYLGMIYGYLPFMVLPLYASLERLPQDLIEASQDLGASSFATFYEIIIPLSAPGIFAGFLLVFIPAVGEYVIPDMLGGPETQMIGKRIYVEYFYNRDWPMAAALAIALIGIVVIPFTALRRWQLRLGTSSC